MTLSSRVRAGIPRCSAPFPRAYASQFLSNGWDLPAQCELTFEAPPDSLAGPGVATGTRLRVAAPPTGVPLFEGEVTATELAY